MTLKIDGSTGEGGGQILRTALALAAVLQRSIEIYNIRGGRKRGGLRPQHLMAVKAMASVTRGRVKGAELGSERLYFEPQKIVPGDYAFDVGTAGSTSLVLQTMMPALLWASGPSRVVVTGGTHVPWSPSFHYLKAVFLPALSRMGVEATLELKRWGWYPKGGGKVVASISPARELHSLNMIQRGDLQDLSILSAVSNLPMSIGKRQQDEALRQLAARGYPSPRVSLVDGPSQGAGTAVFLRAGFEQSAAGFTSLGSKGKPAEAVAAEACSEVFAFMDSEAALDNHLADQLVLYMALAKGRSTVRAPAITGHLTTNMWVIEQFLPVRFDVDAKIGKVSVEGIG
jgi:RNA 3'-terminal phosphate cyclase (ATP)